MYNLCLYPYPCPKWDAVSGNTPLWGVVMHPLLCEAAGYHHGAVQCLYPKSAVVRDILFSGAVRRPLLFWDAAVHPLLPEAAGYQGRCLYQNDWDYGEGGVHCCQSDPGDPCPQDGRCCWDDRCH